MSTSTNRLSRRHGWRTLAAAALLGGSGAWADAEEIRLANGVVVRGEIRQATDSGLEFKTESGGRTYPWYTLSPATRYRLQPAYRANFKDILAGRPAGERQAVATSIREAAPPAAASSALLALDDNARITAIDPAKIPDWGAVSPDSTLSWALRYGPGSKHAAVFLFDVKAAKQLPEHLTVYDLQDGRLDQLEPRRDQRDGQAVVSFGPVRREAAYGAVRVTLDVTVSVLEKKPAEVQVDVQVQLSGPSGSATFGLSGAPASVVVGRKKIAVRDFLMTPSLSVVPEVRDAKPQLIGHIRMGRLKLWPRDGMDRIVDIQIREGSRVVWANKLNLVPAGDREPSLELGGLARGKSYDVSARANLGAYLGELTYQDTLAIP